MPKKYLIQFNPWCPFFEIRLFNSGISSNNIASPIHSIFKLMVKAPLENLGSSIFIEAFTFSNLYNIQLE